MGNELDVWLFDQRIGTLTLREGRLSFLYFSEWLSQPNSKSISLSLPLQTASFDDRATRPFFAGLLPEGRMRRVIAQQFQVSDQNDFALLDHIGGECAGAVTFLEPGQALASIGHQGDVKWLTDAELISTLEELPRRPMLAGSDGLRLSLAGAQDKLPVAFDGVRIGLPRHGMPSSHILKPAIHAVQDSVLNEGFCMALAKAMQFKPAATHIHTVLNRSFLLVERYDRVTDHQWPRQRLHQEDFCQALGFIPEMKYQNEGGPTLKQCFDLIRQVTRPNAPQILRLLDYVIFNTLIGNHDAHAKNFSLLYLVGAPTLAPLYDALSTAIYPSLTVKMAMKIGSKYKFSEVEVRHWEQFAESVGLSKAQTKKRILEIATLLPIAARQLQSNSNYAFAGEAIVEQIVALIEQRSALTIRRLKASHASLNSD